MRLQRDFIGMANHHKPRVSEKLHSQLCIPETPVKGPGIFWREENAEAMLYLRAHLKAGRWDEVVKATFVNVSVAA